MRLLNSLTAAFVASLAVVVTLSAQTTVSTVPVGFNTVTIPAGKSNVVSVPFYQVAKFQGANSAVGSNTITFSGTTLSSTLPAANAPYLARFKSGSSTGRFFIVTSYTDTQLTLDTATAGYTLTTGAPNNTQTQAAVGDSVEIVPANTLGTLFGTTSVPFLTGSVNSADQVLLWNRAAQHFDVYFNNGTTGWRLSGNGNSQNNTVILPDQGLFILRRGNTDLNLTFLGTVPSTPEKTDIPGTGSSFVANRFPVDMTFGGAGNTALNLQNLPSWISGSVNSADQVLLWNLTSQHWDIYFNNGTGWRLSGNGLSQDATKVPLGSAMFILRRSSATGNTSTFSQNLPYTL